MYPADLYAADRTALVRDRIERDLIHRERARAARSASSVPASATVVNRLRVRVGEALVASGTAIAGPGAERGTATASNRPA